MITVNSGNIDIAYRIFANVVEQVARIFLEWPNTEFKSYCKIGTWGKRDDANADR